MARIVHLESATEPERNEAAMSHHTEEEGHGDSPRPSNPRPADAQDAPEPVRPETVQEAEGQAVRDQDDPPKAEGNRDEVDGPPRER